MRSHHSLAHGGEISLIKGSELSYGYKNSQPVAIELELVLPSNCLFLKVHLWHVQGGISVKSEAVQ